MSMRSSRFRAALPAAARKDDEALRALGLRLHDAQSCVAREYGFVSWADLRSFVQARSSYSADRDKGVLDWLRLVYAADIAGGNSRARPTVAARMLEENPRLLGDDRYLACAVGDEPGLRRALSGNRAWVNSAGGPLDLPPLVAVTHSSLLRLPGFRDSLHACAKLLLEAGADPDQAVASRWGSASISEPSEHTGFRRSTELPARITIRSSRGFYWRLVPTPTTASRSIIRWRASPARASCWKPARALRRPTRSIGCSTWTVSTSSGCCCRGVQTPMNRPRARPPPTGARHCCGPSGADDRRRTLRRCWRREPNASARTPDGADAHTLALRFGLPDVAALLGPGRAAIARGAVHRSLRAGQRSCRAAHSVEATRSSPGAVRNTAAFAPRACCARLCRGRQGHGRAGLADCGPRGRLACVGPEPRGVSWRCASSRDFSSSMARAGGRSTGMETMLAARCPGLPTTSRSKAEIGLAAPKRWSRTECRRHGPTLKDLRR